MGQDTSGMGPRLLSGQGVTGTLDRLPVCVREGLCIPSSLLSSPGLLKPQGGGGGHCQHNPGPPAPPLAPAWTGLWPWLSSSHSPSPSQLATPPPPLLSSRGSLVDIKVTSASIFLPRPRKPVSVPEGLYLPLPSLCTLPCWLG